MNSIVKLKRVANLRKIRLISRTHQSVSYTWVETERLIESTHDLKLICLVCREFSLTIRVERSKQAPSRSFKHDMTNCLSKQHFMNALTLHLNNAFYCARKKTPLHDINSRNPLIGKDSWAWDIKHISRQPSCVACECAQCAAKILEWWKHLRNGLFDSRRRQSSMTQFSYCVSSQNKPQTICALHCAKTTAKKVRSEAMSDVISREWLH